MSTITKFEAEEIAGEAGLDENAVYPDYSGRGMYGKQCLGFIYSSTNDLLRLGAALSAALDGDVPAASTDSMGRDGIVYFPSLSVTE